MMDNNTTIGNTFGERLAYLRKKKGFKSQMAFADEIGMAYQTINYYESGKRKPDIEVFKLLADYFNVSYDFLLCVSDCENRDNIDIQKELGLSEDNISLLKRINKNNEYPYNPDNKDNISEDEYNSILKEESRERMNIINHLISSLFLEDFIDDIRGTTRSRIIHNTLKERTPSIFKLMKNTSLNNDKWLTDLINVFTETIEEYINNNANKLDDKELASIISTEIAYRKFEINSLEENTNKAFPYYSDMIKENIKKESNLFIKILSDNE